jgi:hypothetical protein
MPRSVKELRAIFAKLKYGRIARDVGRVALGAGAAYGAVKAYPHARKYFSREQRQLRKTQRETKKQIKQFTLAERHAERQNLALKKLDTQTRDDLRAIAKDLQRSNMLGSKQGFVKAVIQAQQLQRLEAHVRSAIESEGVAKMKVAERMMEEVRKLPERSMERPLSQMSQAEQRSRFDREEQALEVAQRLAGDMPGTEYLKAMGYDKKGNLLDPLTGKPIASEEAYVTRQKRTGGDIRTVGRLPTSGGRIKPKRPQY